MNKKWLKIGIPILVAVTVLTVGLGTGYALASGKEIGPFNSQTVAFDPEYNCPNCPGFQNCPYLDNWTCPGYNQDKDSGQYDGCWGRRGGGFTNNDSNQPQFGGCCR